MCDVTKENFEKLYPVIAKAIQKSAFIAIDGEFTGLSTSTSYEPSLFDTPEIRYQKLKKSLSQFTICQFGVSAFVPEENIENSYVAHTFNFFVFPQSFGSIDAKFSCQASSLEFLSKHEFDFNKFIKDGIPYMNNNQEKLLRSHYETNTIQHNMSSMLLRQIDELYVNPSLWKIDEFLKTTLSNDTMELPGIPFGLSLFLLLKSIEKRFANVSCSWKNEKLVIKKVFNIDKKVSHGDLYERLLENAIGVTRILRVISRSGKPIVGHNCLSDVILIYERFISQLPDSYEKFKFSLHKHFPTMYDTKHIVYVLRKEFKNMFDATSLEDVYNLFKSSQGIHHRVCTPKIKHAPNCKKYENAKAPHEAGYDAYLTGFIFIRLAHLIATKDISLSEEIPIDFADHLHAIKAYENRVNIPRAAVRFLNFGGEDAPVIPPERFIVYSRTGGPIVPAQVAQEFLLFGSVDVKLRSSKEAIIAVSNRRRARDVIKAFHKNKAYHVTKFDWWIHSEEAIKLYWYGGIISSITVLTATVSLFLWKGK